MKRKISLFAMLTAGVFILALNSSCGHYKPLGFGLGSNAPHLVHVYNGQTLGYYTTTGAYGFGSSANSIFSLGQNYGSGQQVVQNTSDGSFYIGTTSCTSGCDLILFFAGYSGGFRSGSLASSSATLATNGTAAGLAFDPGGNRLYVADNVHNTLGFVTTTTQQLNPSTPYLAPAGRGAKFVGYDTGTSTIVVDETTQNSAWFMNGDSGTYITSSPNPLVLTGAGCTSANISYIYVNPIQHLAYVLCGNTVVFLSTNTTPTYGIGGALGTSTVALSNITGAADITMNTINNTIIVGGQKYVTALDPQSGVARAALDLTSGDCGLATVTVSGVAYSPILNEVFVSDSANSRVYVLNASTLAFANTLCSKSSFSTPDVPGPTRITFF